MRVLLIKTSSMGDLIHTLPALSDAGKALPKIRFDWMVEDSFVEIPALHPLVNKVIPVALRRWRKGLIFSKTSKEWQLLKATLKNEKYDLVLDAQGLVKSAFLMFFTQGKRAGLDFSSARESLASFMYQEKYNVNFYQHAIVRMRSLFSQALNYSLPDSAPDFGLKREQFRSVNVGESGSSAPCAHCAHGAPYVVFLHGTTWRTKLWPEHYWVELARYINGRGIKVKLSGGNDTELARAKRIQLASGGGAGVGDGIAGGVEVLPRLTITEIMQLLANASAVVAVDTGFGHLAAALDVPIISLYGATNEEYTGAIGSASVHMSALHPCAPCLKKKCHYKGPAMVYPACYASISPKRVWQVLKRMI